MIPQSSNSPREFMPILLKKYFIVSIVFLVTIIMSGNIFAHGLTMTTAEIILRHNSHVTITVRTALTALFNDMQWRGKPATLLHLTSDDKALAQFRTELAKLFSEKMPVSFNNILMESANLRIAKLPQLKRQLQTEIANGILVKTMGHEEHDRKNYLVVNIDGFMQENVKNAEINIVFPAELADVMVSYSKPQVQTLSGKGKKHNYRQVLNN